MNKKQKECEHQFMFVFETPYTRLANRDTVYCNVCNKTWHMAAVRRALIEYEERHRSGGSGRSKRG